MLNLFDLTFYTIKLQVFVARSIVPELQRELSHCKLRSQLVSLQFIDPKDQSLKIVWPLQQT